MRGGRAAGAVPPPQKGMVNISLTLTTPPPSPSWPSACTARLRSVSPRTRSVWASSPAPPPLTWPPSCQRWWWCPASRSPWWPATSHSRGSRTVSTELSPSLSPSSSSLSVWLSGHVTCLELCIYGIRELASATSKSGTTAVQYHYSVYSLCRHWVSVCTAERWRYKYTERMSRRLTSLTTVTSSTPSWSFSSS